jgi:ABC-type dipeptide/oligopeptide/nickel transport system permease component
MAMSITLVLALSARVFAASRHRRLGDVGVMGLTQSGIAIPNFWFASLLILLFAVNLRWFAAGGAGVGRGGVDTFVEGCLACEVRVLMCSAPRPSAGYWYPCGLDTGLSARHGVP